MAPQTSTNRQTRSLRRTLAGALLIAAGTAAPATADIWSWNTGNGNWMTPGNWLPNSVPGLDPSVDQIIRIGDLPWVQNSTVLLNNAIGGGSIYYSSLSLSSGMTLDLNGRQMGSLIGAIDLTDSNSRLIVRSSTGTNFNDLNASLITIGTGSILQMADNGRARSSTLFSSGVIRGWGTLTLGISNIGAVLTNNGIIEGASNGGLTIIQDGTMRLDLDGVGAEGPSPGQLSLAAPFSVLTFQGDQLHDFFGGTVTMGSGSLLNMNMSDGWTADGMSTFNVASSIAGAAAQISGGHFTFHGNLNIGGSHGHLRMLADTTIHPAANVFLGNDDRLEFDADTIVNGGTYTLSNGARIDFDAPTDIGGGTFTMVGNLPAQGQVNFNNDTQWRGTTTINGFARQVGNASVSTPTTINANVLDMDGNNTATWTINHALTVNTQAIEHGSQQFDGTLNMNAGAVGRLTINLADPAAAWTMNGTMNLAGLGVLTTTRVAGSRMVVTGDLNMGAGIAQITADTAFQGADVNIAHNGNLRMRAVSTVDAATSFSGAGTLQNGPGGAMTLDSGVSLGQAALVNDALLRIGANTPAIVSVDRFANSAAALLSVEIGGYVAGAEHDLLLVTGGAATLNGVLTVNLLSLGGGAVFAPGIGDEFTIISALGGVSGAFSNDPVTQVGGLTYDWTIVYNPNTVVLRLDGIVPAPGSLALLGLGGLVVVRRRRSGQAESHQF